MSREIGTVTVSFLGVCTIFLDLPSQVPPGTEVPPNRVVLARATKDFRKQTGVYPHMGRLQIDAGEIIFQGPPPPLSGLATPNTFNLDGAYLKVANALETQLSIQLGCLPSLRGHLREGTLGPPAEAVYMPDPTLVQAWFDVSHGVSWNAFLMSTDPPCNLVPSISILTVQTDGAPALEYNRFDLTRQPTVITLLGERPNVNVMNFACGEGFVDEDEDFLLNYQLAATVPLQSSITIPSVNICNIPSSSAGAVYKINGCGDAGPGCSNTTYP